jgi:hypothetical protein
MPEPWTIIFCILVWMYIGHRWSRLILRRNILIKKHKKFQSKRKCSGFFYKNQKCLAQKGGKINKRI